MQETIAVAVPAPVFGSFDYVLPLGMPRPQPGARVRVPFGRRSVVGVVTNSPDGPQKIRAEYREISAVLDRESLLPSDVLALCEWTAAYYHHPLGETIATALPGALRQGRSTEIERETWLRLSTRGADALSSLPARSVKQRALLQSLSAQPQPTDAFAASLVRTAREREWVVEISAPPPVPAAAERAPALTAEQQQALQALQALQAAQGFAVTLLEGVTGSGKTEVYLRCVERARAAGTQALLLTPEIGLTPQLFERVQRRFGARCACYHSGMTEAQRTDTWLRARNGEVDVLIGTRSAVFVPLPRLGLVVVDEEHDASFKQQEGLRYHARDVAIVRAQRAGAPVILGSATPSLETLHSARTRRYRHLELTQRIAAAGAPAVRVVDTRGQGEGLSPTLIERVRTHLEQGGQALVFLNRRGYAPTLLCADCGWLAGCSQCDARMTLHRGRTRLVCHHCGRSQAAPVACPQCGHRQLAPVGQGTERLETTLRETFAGWRIERFDSDRLQQRGQLERLLADVGSGDVKILVGTQILAKGHDFPGLSLAAIVSVDQALYGSDFRALERMGQLVTQVTGRAGRADVAGEVLLQTRQPQHPLLLRLLRDGYPALADALLEERRMTELPPYAHLALLRAEAPTTGKAMEFLAHAAAEFGQPAGVEALGPVPATMERRAGRYRAQLLLRAKARPALHRALTGWVRRLDALPGARKVRWSIDVDPVDLF